MAFLLCASFLAVAQPGLPPAIEGDFDGDGVVDVAYYADEGDGPVLKASLSSLSETLTVDRSRGPNLFLDAVEPGPRVGYCSSINERDCQYGETEASASLPHVGIGTGTEEASFEIHYWTGSRFETLYVSD